MDQGILRESLDKHLERVEKIILWALPVAAVIGWAGMHTSQGQIELLGLKAHVHEAYIVGASAFVLANLALLLSIWRIRDLIGLMSDSEFTKGIDKLVTHPFLFNPFAYFGSTIGARIHSSLGFGLLIVCWWICYTALSTLRAQSILPPAVEVIFLGIGLLSMAAIQKCSMGVESRMKKIDPGYAQELEAHGVQRALQQLITFALILAGGLIYLLVNSISISK